MLIWLQENLASLIAGLAVLGTVVLIVWKLVRDKRAGRKLCAGSCGGGCSGCPMQGKCHGA